MKVISNVEPGRGQAWFEGVRVREEGVCEEQLFSVVLDPDDGSSQV